MMNNATTAGPSASSATPLALDLLAAIHGEVRGRERQAVDGLVAWLDAVDSPIAGTIRSFLGSLEPRRALCVDSMRKSLFGGFRSDDHWANLDARAILTRACVLFVLATITDQERKNPEVRLFPVQAFRALSTLQAEPEAPWLLLAPLVRNALHDQRAPRPEDIAQAIAKDIVIWGVDTKVRHIEPMPARSDGIFDAIDRSDEETRWLQLALILQGVIERTHCKRSSPNIAHDILVWAHFHRRLDDLLGEVGRISRSADDQELRALASAVAQVAGTPYLHT